jgi:hypothetical protein
MNYFSHLCWKIEGVQKTPESKGQIGSAITVPRKSGLIAMKLSTTSLVDGQYMNDH